MGNRCTNRSGTAGDSWSGALDAGDHKVVVYPSGGGSGDYTLTLGAEAAFEKERLPIVLTPFHLEGLVPSAVRFGLIEVQTGAKPDVVREAASVESDLQFGPGRGCEVQADRVLCVGGASDVIGEESSDPW